MSVLIDSDGPVTTVVIDRRGRTLDLILTGRGVGAEEALAMGLVDRVVPSGQARQRPRRSPASWPRCRRGACATTGCRCSTRRDDRG